jgi:tetratricopeptide (TPR) repeat protein
MVVKSIIYTPIAALRPAVLQKNDRGQSGAWIASSLTVPAGAREPAATHDRLRDSAGGPRFQETSTMTHRRFRAALSLAVAVCLAASAVASAQDWKGKGKIGGVVTDPAGKPLEGATIKLHFGDDPAAGPPTVTSDKNGKWLIEKLAFGTWNLEITAPGYEPLTGPVPLSKEQAAPSLTVKLAPENLAGKAIDEGNKLFNQHKWAEARAAYEKAMAALTPEQESNRHGLQLMIAQIDVRMKQSPKAIESLQAMLAQKADDQEALRILAQAQREAGQKDAAIDTLKKVIELAPQDNAVYDFLLEWLVEAKRAAEAEQYLAKAPGKIDPVTLLNLGIQYFNDKKYPEAITKFDAVVAANPERTESLYFRGLAQMEMKKYAEARADFEKLLSVDAAAAKAPDARFKLAILDYEAKDYAAALAKLDQSAQELPQRGEVFYFRGYTKLALKKNAEAKADLQKFVALAPADPRIGEVQTLIKKLK